MALATKKIETREAALAGMRSKLLTRKNEIIMASSASIKNRLSDENSEAKDEADLANASSNHWMDVIHHNKRNNELAQIDQALLKLQEGTYGICEECEEPINERRLQVRPFATLCVECQEEKEKSGVPAYVRSISEDESVLDMAETNITYAK